MRDPHCPRSLTSRQLTLAVFLLLPVLVLSAGSQTQRIAEGARPRILKQLNTSEKVAALTFDDGPDPRFTPRILAELKRNGIKATFFLIGEQVALHPALAKRIIAEGHVIGNHSYTHPHLDQMPERVVAAELVSCDEILQSIGARKPTLFRAPRGDLSSTLLRVAKQRGYTLASWWVCADNRSAPTPELMAKRVLDRAAPGMIVLIHDGRVDIREKDVKALPLIITGLQVRGYRFVALEGKWLQ